ncbi:MAG: hypothetical protein AB7I33_10825, partial [Gemmatimonadales bacterium]
MLSGACSRIRLAVLAVPAVLAAPAVPAAPEAPAVPAALHRLPLAQLDSHDGRDPRFLHGD